jgi:hypothetical protein
VVENANPTDEKYAADVVEKLAPQVNTPAAVTDTNDVPAAHVFTSMSEKSVPSTATVTALAPLPLRRPVSDENIGARVSVCVSKNVLAVYVFGSVVELCAQMFEA